jgi:hypothetical protein
VLVNPFMVVANHSTHFVRDNLSGMLVEFKLKISLHFESSFFLVSVSDLQSSIFAGSSPML